MPLLRAETKRGSRKLRSGSSDAGGSKRRSPPTSSSRRSPKPFLTRMLKVKEIERTLVHERPSLSPLSTACRYRDIRRGRAGRTVLLSTRPMRVEAAVQGLRRWTAVEIRDAYDTKANQYQSDGYLKGELLSAPAENRPGRPTLPADPLAARPLPRVPLSSDVRIRLHSPLTRSADQGDTLRVWGTLRPQTTRLPAGREVVADRDGTPSARFREQRVTYEFSEDGSVRVYALAEDDPTAVKGPGRRGHLEGACPHSGS